MNASLVGSYAHKNVRVLNAAIHQIRLKQSNTPDHSENLGAALQVRENVTVRSLTVKKSIANALMQIYNVVRIVIVAIAIICQLVTNWNRVIQTESLKKH